VAHVYDLWCRTHDFAFVSFCYYRRVLGSPPRGDKMGGNLVVIQQICMRSHACHTPDSAFSRGNDMLLLLGRRSWFQQIDHWRNARPILERLG
jgi:hypothetical protein